MRFQSSMASLESQKYVIAGTVLTGTILLVNGRFVLIKNQIVFLLDP